MWPTGTPTQVVPNHGILTGLWISNILPYIFYWIFFWIFPFLLLTLTLYLTKSRIWIIIYHNYYKLVLLRFLVSCGKCIYKVYNVYNKMEYFIHLSRSLYLYLNMYQHVVTSFSFMTLTLAFLPWKLTRHNLFTCRHIYMCDGFLHYVEVHKCNHMMKNDL